MKKCRFCGTLNIDSKTWCTKCLKRLNVDMDMERMGSEESVKDMRSSPLVGSMGRTPYGSTKTEYPLNERRTVTVGRDPNCDIVDSSPYVSMRHFKIDSREGRFFVQDLGSHVGTYVNGVRLHGNLILQDGDCISICDRNFYFRDGKIIHWERERKHEKVSEVTTEKPVILKADIESKRVKNHNGSGTKELIRDIHLEIREGTLVALLGTAGAGKSTVMNCLNGMDLEGVRGKVLYRDVDLMKSFEQMKYLIGSVPQKKTFHKSFTPEQEFRLAARKRLPADTSDEEIEDRVNKTLKMLSMTGVRNNRNSKLSGGEQTRVNVGIELVADRDLLCLDEPDQGLSPNYKHELFEILHNLAHENGKSVLSIIHDVSEIDMFDQVIMLAKVDGVGQLAFSGTPEEGRAYFGVDIRDAYALLDKDPARYIKKKA